MSTAEELIDAINTGECDAVDIARQALWRAEELADYNMLTSASLYVNAAAVRAARGTPLAGLPVVIKDNINTRGFACSNGTEALRAWFPERDAGVVARLKSAGATIIAKANMHEMALGITSNNPVFGPVRNPHDPSLSAGGSSGGSAAVVASGVAPISLGTDTAGSCRIPAAHCGCVGFRPTTGRYPADGIGPLSFTRDTAGVLAASVCDVALVDRILSGAVPGSPLNPVALDQLRLGVPRPYFFDNLDPATSQVIERALAQLENEGATLVETEVWDVGRLVDAVSLPLAFYEMARDFSIYLARSGCPHSIVDVVERISGSFERDAWARELSDNGTPVSLYHSILEEGRPRVIAAYRDCFARDELDALVLPTVPLPARPIGQDETVALNGQQVSTLMTNIRNVDPTAIAGMPSLSLPAGVTAQGLPVGLLLDALPGGDLDLLSLALAVEECLGRALREGTARSTAPCGDSA